MAEDTAQEERGTTPEKWDTRKDPLETPGEYPNYWVRKTRSGHVFRIDDTEDNEHIVLQHRSGTQIRLHADGGFEVIAHKGMQETVHGERRSKITGAHDTTVDGDVSLKAKKNYNATINGDSAVSIKGKSVESAKSKSITTAEGAETVTGWETKKVNNSSVEQVLGAKTMVSEYGMTLASTGDSMAIGAKSGLGLKSGGETAIESGSKMSIKSTGGDIAFDGTKVYINCGQSSLATQVASMRKAPSPKTETDYEV